MGLNGPGHLFTMYDIKKLIFYFGRLTVKTLIDKACITNIDDDSDELINFCAAIEQILTYRQKGILISVSSPSKWGQS